MRSGTRTEVKRRWTPCGHRPCCKIRIGYEYTYLYAALNPYDGHLIALLLPTMQKVCFEVFMDYFAEQVALKHGTARALLIADGAASHQMDAIKSDTVDMVRLPRACPELNPAERFFQALRPQMSNQVFETIEQVEDHLCVILKQYFEQPAVVMSLASFPGAFHFFALVP